MIDEFEVVEKKPEVTEMMEAELYLGLRVELVNELGWDVKQKGYPSDKWIETVFKDRIELFRIANS